ncbi:DUF998 domain-containing protein [Halovenus rubra]|uniref:DUF998 domain-containing protein n=2 Tax=Halovenus rubra TaxID=869890 RepID=A0ABD5X5A6_9EURY|nr:DUF998 domain-containing protein [Halovenus rubra]
MQQADTDERHAKRAETRSHLFDRATVWSGIVAPVLALGCVALSTLIASSAEFTWAGKALSDLGRREASTFWLFNGGLFGGGTIGVFFTRPLWRHATNRVERLSVVSFLISVTSLALIGVFYLPRDPHGFVAMLFFVGGPITHVLYGIGLLQRGETRGGWLSVGFGVVHVFAWSGWFGYIAATGSSDYFAVPEMLAALAFGGWAIAVTRQLQRETT